MVSHGHSHSGHHLHPSQEGPFHSTGLLMAGWGRPVVEPMNHQSTWTNPLGAGQHSLKEPAVSMWHSLTPHRFLGRSQLKLGMPREHRRMLS